MSRNRRVVPQHELVPLLEELHAFEATDIRKEAAHPDGSVEVTWKDPKGLRRTPGPWALPFALTAFVLVLIAVLAVLVLM